MVHSEVLGFRVIGQCHTLYVDARELFPKGIRVVWVWLERKYCPARCTCKKCLKVVTTIGPDGNIDGIGIAVSINQ
jgi:hypothetical protein